MNFGSEFRGDLECSARVPQILSVLALKQALTGFRSAAEWRDLRLRGVWTVDVSALASSALHIWYAELLRRVLPLPKDGTAEHSTSEILRAVFQVATNAPAPSNGSQLD